MSAARTAALLCSLALGTFGCMAPPPSQGTTKDPKQSGTQQPQSTACGMVSQRGLCQILGSTPSVALRCSTDGQKLLTDDCASRGLVCKVDATQGAVCVSSSQAPGSTGTSASPNTSCGTVTEKGTCSGSVMKWCSNNKLLTSDCAYDAGFTCKMVSGEAKCVDQSGTTGTTTSTTTACGSTPATGECVGSVMNWCGNGQKFTTDCAYDAGFTCQMVNGEAKCVDTASQNNCGSITALGTCDGTVMKWCSNGQVLSSDCAYDVGYTCQVESSGEAQCVSKTNPCGDVTDKGICDGTILRWCINGQRLESSDCAYDAGYTCQVNSSGEAVCVHT